MEWDDEIEIRDALVFLPSIFSYHRPFSHFALLNVRVQMRDGKGSIGKLSGLGVEILHELCRDHDSPFL